MKLETDETISLDEFLNSPEAYINAVSEGPGTHLTIDTGNGNCVVIGEGGEVRERLNFANMAHLALINDEGLRRRVLSLFDGTMDPATGEEELRGKPINELAESFMITSNWSLMLRISGIIGPAAHLPNPASNPLRRKSQSGL